ncbi:MAG TPA: hypothetical protein PK668_20685 [Myxococcota bacterium]|nr:hypothetical protein [Myxococcota bacterium]HRY96248.1 hypothetical protein [Myxococcota bacterium]
MRNLTVVLSLLAVLGFSMSVLAAAPAYVPVQGYLTDADGAPVDAEVSMTLVLWDSMSGGTPVFSETQQVLVEQGFFTLYLGGAGTPVLDLAIFRDNGSLFMGVAVNGEAEMAPRLSMGSVPYAGFAQYAGDALTLGGLTVEDFRLGTDEVSWDDLTGVPDTLLDGDADALAGLACGAGQVAKWDGAAWACADDALGAGVSEAEVDGFVANNGYALTADLAAVAFSGDWNDLVNVPAALLDGDADTLAGIACASGQVIKWTGAAWGCADDIDTDTDTDTLANLFCGDGQVAKSVGGVWACADDVDTDTDTTLSEAEVDAFVANNGYALSADLELVAFTGDYNDLLNVPAGLLDGDDDTLAGLTCADGQLPAWDDTNAVWECVDDLDTDTLMTLACLDGQVAKWDGLAGAWACADDIDTDTNTQLTEAEVDAFVANNGYAMASHNHDAVYALLGHDHDADYADIGHNHDATYVNEGQADSISSAMIQTGAVGSLDIADGSIGSIDIANNTIDSQDILDNSIVLADVALASFDSRYALTGHNHDAAYVNVGEPNSIDTWMIVDGTIRGFDIEDGSIGTDDIGDGQVSMFDIAINQIRTQHIFDGEVSSADIANDTITAADIASGAVGTSEIADVSIVLADISTASFDTRYSLVTHNHDATYVNEGQANSVTPAMETMEAGAEFGQGFAQIDPTGTEQTAATINMTWPGSGQVTVMVDATVYCATNAWFDMKIRQGAWHTGNWVRGVPRAGEYVNMELSGTFPVVGAGAGDITVTVWDSPDNCNFFAVHNFSAIYTPTRY